MRLVVDSEHYERIVDESVRELCPEFLELVRRSCFGVGRVSDDL